MLELLGLIGVVPVLFVVVFVLYRGKRRGSSPVTTESVAYDRNKYSTALDWDSHGFIVNGNKIQLFSGEFHYWRLPDTSRWEHILIKYKASGLNAIRIYFHWGFHSPNEGEYHFDGNRDVTYLLQLCVKLRIFVLCAPGPYICAETSAGGYPFWLLAKKNIKIRHTKRTLQREWYHYHTFHSTHRDHEFAYYSLEWWSTILSLLKPFQITESNNGCILGLQIENEYFEKIGPIPLGLADEMKFLCHHARRLGMTVPFFTNDGLEVGSYIPKKNSSLFGIDLYGFDKYVIFVPISHPLVNVFGGEKYRHIKNWKPWNPSDFANSIDSVETIVRNFGGAAAETPIFVPELQGGWFNHYHLDHTYDDIYNYYGEAYTKNIFESIVAQGSNAFNFYMFYGGTNWATIGDPDVYTSYDYSACIREYGFLSGRGRRLRLAIAFTRSFKSLYRETKAIKSTVSVFPKAMLNKQRQTISNAPHISTVFTFIRNFSNQTDYTLAIGTTSIKGRIPFKHSFVSLGNYNSTNQTHLIASTIPIHFKTVIGKDEIWIIQSDDEVSGQFAFKGVVSIKGPMQHHAEYCLDSTIISLHEHTGWLSIDTLDKGSLYIIALTGNDLFTLNPIWEEEWFSNNKSHNLCFWGTTDSSFDHVTNTLDVSLSKRDEISIVLAKSCPKLYTILDKDHPLFNCPYIFGHTFNDVKPNSFHIAAPLLLNWTTRLTSFESFPWKYIPVKFGSSLMLNPAMDLYDLGYNSGHVFYRIKFSMTGNVAYLDLNARHRVTLYLNNKAIGGHMTYSLHLFRAGSKVGPDAGFLGTQRYVLPPHLLAASNVLVIQVENFGYNRQAFLFNDVKNHRGITESRLVPGKKSAIQNIQLEIAGVDTRTLDNVYLTSGFPDELLEVNVPLEVMTATSLDPSPLQPQTHILNVPIHSVPIWYSCTFDNANVEHDRPLRLLFDGQCTAYMWINDVLIGKYYGNGDGPQKSFYVMDGLLKPTGNVLKLICYDGRIDVEHDAKLTVSLAEWKVSSDLHEFWTGNKCEKGEPFILIKKSLTL